jgi:hypothetical protein
MRILQKWADIKLPLKGLVDLLPANLLDNSFSPNLQNMELDEGVVRSRKGYTLNSTVDIEAYKTGTVVTTQGSATVTGIGTTWLVGHKDNSFTNLVSAEKSYLVDSVESNTSLTLSDVFSGETTRKKLTKDAEYAGTDTPTTMCWDGTNHWGIVNVGGTYKIRKYSAVMATISDTVIAAPITIPTGITAWGTDVWVAGKDSTKQYLQNVTGGGTLNDNWVNNSVFYGIAYAAGNIYLGYTGGLSMFFKYNLRLNTFTDLTAGLPANDCFWRATRFSYDGDEHIYTNCGTPNDGIYRYNIVKDTWEYCFDATTITCPVYYDGYLYGLEYGVGSGKGFFRYDVNTGIIENLSNVISDTSNILDCSLKEADGGIYYLAGYDGNSFSKYNISTDTWEALDVFPGTTNNTYRDLSYKEGYFYALDGGHTQTFFRYSVSLNQWTPMTDCMNMSSKHGCVVVGDKIYTAHSSVVAGDFIKYNISGDTWDDDYEPTIEIGTLSESDTPQIEDITVVSSKLWSYAGFWDSDINSFSYKLVKHGDDLTTFEKYESPTDVKEMGLHNKGTNLLCRVKEDYYGILYDFIYELTPVGDGNLMTTVGKYSTEVEHDEGLGTYVRGISYDGSVLWSCQSTDTTTVKFLKYFATLTGDSYSIAGLTDNLFNFKKWDGSETMVWSTIPKGKVAYSSDTREWFILKTELNASYHVSFITFMNNLFACNGYDDAWSWEGANKHVGASTASATTTTMIDTNLADNVWQGSAIVMTSGSNDGEMSKITGWNNGTKTLTFSPAFSNVTTLNDIYYIALVVTDPNKITAGDISHDAAKTSMPKGKLLAVFQNRLWTNDKDHPNILRCSGLHFGVDTGMSDTWDAIQQFQIANDDIITGLHTAGDRMYVFAERNTYILMGSGGFTSYQLVKLDEPVGLLSDKGAAVKDNTAIFCGRGGIYQVIGREIKKLSNGIKNFFNTIQQTKVYKKTWVQSSEAEFNNGDNDSGKVNVGEGRLTISKDTDVWTTDDNFNDNDVAGSQVRVGVSNDTIALIDYTNEKGNPVVTNKLGGNIAPNSTPSSTTSFYTDELGWRHYYNDFNYLGASQDNSYSTYSYARCKIKAERYLGIHSTFSSTKRVGKITVEAVYYNHENFAWTAHFVVKNHDGGTLFTHHFTVNPGANSVTKVFETDKNSPKQTSKISVLFWKGCADVGIAIHEVTIQEWEKKTSYTTITPHHDYGSIIFLRDSGIVNPIWGEIGIEYLHNDCAVKLQARVSANNTDWIDGSGWETFGEVEKVQALQVYKGVPAVQRQRYIQVKVTLYTDVPASDDNHTPVISTVFINRFDNSSAVYTSAARLLSSEITAWDVFDAKQNVPEGTALKFEITSADSEAHLGEAAYPWVEIIPGNKPQGYTDESGTTYFQWRVTLLTTTNETPEVNAGYIWWLEGGEQLTPMCSIIHDHKYFLSIATTRIDGESSKINNDVLVINREGNFERIKGLSVSGFTIFKDRLYAGASDSGFIYLLEEGYSDNKKELEAYIETIDYNFNYEFRKNLSNHYKNLFQVYCEGRISEDNLSIGYSFDGGNTWSEVEIVMSNLKGHEVIGNVFKVRKYLPFGKQGKMIRFRVKGNTLTDYIELHSLRVFLKISPITGS